jgi:hypothetical protein
MRPWFAALASLLVCLSARSQQLPSAPAGAPATTASQAGTTASRAGTTASRAGTAASGTSAPQTVPVYRVELVVFRALSALGGPENWSAESGAAGGTPAQPDTDPGATTARAPETHAALRMLPSSEFQLDGAVARLRSSGRYLPIAHAAWWQSASPWGRPTEIPVQSLGLAAQGLTGTLSLQRGEFLHLELSLDYAPDDPPAGLGAAPGTVFSLHQMQRVRFNQRSYFDHPAFGVIALVTPAQASRRARK